LCWRLQREPILKNPPVLPGKRVANITNTSEFQA
jgi:hypothetical protein